MVDNNDDDNDDGRRSMGILSAHLLAFGSGELIMQHPSRGLRTGKLRLKATVQNLYGK